ncbi:hypothetical protein E2C01_024971 [Portunus trituberculatus]|uniref:Uncharacterized protein n=1 Tax=Portunus trituberculatus TaxID=210409 RepID=A0A5B7EGL5_PORTR|nr:hypothetical protein [Portunus trituberculatus]
MIVALMLEPFRHELGAFQKPCSFMLQTCLNPKKAYESDGIYPTVLKNCVSMLAPCLAKLFQLLSIDFYHFFLLEVSLHSACF